MRITSLKLERFGHFADATLELGDGLTLLWGANEAGKSTLLASLRALLFGFARGESFDFRWPADTIAVAGTLQFSDGSVAEIRREKKRGLRGTLDEELLRARMGRPSAEMFSTVFAFGLDDLARGGEALRDEGLRAAIAGAGLGAARSPQAVIDELKSQAESLFTPKGRAGKLINSTLGELKERERALREAQVRGDDYRERVAARDAARAEAAARGDERTALLRAIGEKEALARALPWRDELRGARAERARLRPPPLPPTAGEEFERWRGERAQKAEEAARLDEKLSRATSEAEAIAVDERLLAASPRLRGLREQLGRHVEEARQAEELTASLRTRRIELERQLAALRPGWALDELDVLPHPLFTAGLERLREGWSAQRERRAELERLAAARRELDGKQRVLRRRLDPPWAIEDAAPFLPVPRAEEVKQQRAALQQAERALAELKRDDERLQREQRDVESKRARLDAGGAVPSTEELTRLRAARDEAWAQLKRARTDRAALGEVFEAAMRAADAHADELRRRSDDVAKHRELSLRLGELERARADRAVELRAAADERARLDGEWRALWSRCGFAPQSPETMLEWLGDYAELRKLEAERARLDERMAELGGADADYGERLRALLATLKLDEAMELSAAKRVVDTVLAVRVDLEELRRDEERARKLGADAAAWRAEVKRLCGELAPSLATLEPAAAARALDEKLAAAESARQRRAHLAALAEELTAERAACKRRQREIERALEAWRKRAGADDDDAFVAAAAAARRAHELDREIARLERALAEARGAMSAEAFDAALERAERGVVAAELAELRARLDAVDGAWRAASERVGAAEATLAQLDGGARAAELTVGLEARRAELRGFVEQYAVVTLARTLLEREVARFQERHQPRMLEELSSLFAALTGGRYRRVYPRYDDEGTFIAVRSDGVEVVPAAMSTGTREQLWLAVRLAYVRQYCEAAEPLPLVLDDVLVNFDAARARATLQVLAEFASRTQVLLLTCHAHLVELAKEVAGVAPLPLPSAA